MRNTRNKELEFEIQKQYGIDVEFCEPYTGKYPGSYAAEIFFIDDAKAQVPSKKFDLVDLVTLLNNLKISINNQDSESGVICRHTQGIRATNQILFKDKQTLEKFKNKITAHPLKHVQASSPLRESSIFQPEPALDKKTKEVSRSNISFDYKKIFG